MPLLRVVPTVGLWFKREFLSISARSALPSCRIVVVVLLIIIMIIIVVVVIVVVAVG